MAKTAAFGVMHLGISFGVGYVLTGSVAVAGAVALVEPVVNAVAHHFFDKHWDSLGRRWQAALGQARATPAPQRAGS